VRVRRSPDGCPDAGVAPPTTSVTPRAEARLRTMVTSLVVETRGRGLLEITDRVADLVAASGLDEGLCTLFLQHTSASLTVQENADPSARRDLEAWLDRLVPEYDPLYTHTAEGPDDMPSHVKAILTATSLAIPISGGRLTLGTWQGIYLWEHRTRPHRRRLAVYLGG
jgi:secondary thiamine-phosphate synthase enzyme